MYFKQPRVVVWSDDEAEELETVLGRDRKQAKCEGDAGPHSGPPERIVIIGVSGRWQEQQDGGVIFVRPPRAEQRHRRESPKR